MSGRRDEELPLFGYGTFRHAPWREAIFGAAYPAEPATLRGYRRIACSSGYLSLHPAPVAATVDGVLIGLDAIGWAIADRWEEVPKYRRVRIVVETAHGPVEAIAYRCADERGAVAVDDDRLAENDDAAVEAAIAAFEPAMRALRRP